MHTQTRSRRDERSGGTLSLEICRAQVFSGYLCLEYTVTPASRACAAERPVSGAASGVVVTERAGSLPECVSSYRVVADGSHYAGALMVGPGVRPDHGPIRVLFAPLARTESMGHELCEVEVEIRDARVLRVSARMH